MKYELGFIGCGNMGGALVAAAVKKVDGNSIAVCDHSEEKTKKLQSYGVAVTTAEDIAANARFVVLGVKPQALEVALSPLVSILRDRTDVILVSMAVGTPIATVQRYAGGNFPVIRIMPNTPVAVGEGTVLYCCSAEITSKQRTDFLEYFSMAGVFDPLPEEKIDGGSALTGCGPAFVYAFAEALADGGVECGIPREQAAVYAAQTLKGAAEMLLTYGNPADLKNAVCSPGGTTIAGMHALETAGFRGAVMDAVTAAYKRALELKK